MPRGFLTAYADELVTVYQATTSAPDELGQAEEVLSDPAQLVAHVQPLGSDAAARMGLEGETERLRVRFAPPVLIVVGSRVEARGRQWQVIRVEPWQSFTTCIMEETR